MTLEINLDSDTLEELSVALGKCLLSDFKFDFLTPAEHSVLDALSNVFEEYLDNPNDMICSFIGT